MTEWPTIALRLREERQRRGLSAAALAVQINVPATTLSEVERGLWRPADDIVNRWCEALGFRIDSTLVPSSTPAATLTAAQEAALGAVLTALPTLGDREARQLSAFVQVFAPPEAR